MISYTESFLKNHSNHNECKISNDDKVLYIRYFTLLTNAVQGIYNFSSHMNYSNFIIPYLMNVSDYFRLRCSDEKEKPLSISF